MSDNLGPLTTTFVPPTPCASEASRIYQVPDDDLKFWAQGPVDLGNCWPSGYLTSNNLYYSPGICPSGYQPACNNSNVIGASTETIQTCCPVALSYTCQSEGHPGWGDCYWNLPSTWTLTSVYIISDDQTTIVPNVTGITGAINALGIQVRFQSTDFQTSTAANTISSITTPTADVSTSSQSGISQSARVGIGVGVSLGGLVLLLIIGIFYVKRKRRSSAINREAYELPSESKHPTEIGGVATMHELSNHVQTPSPAHMEHSHPPIEIEDTSASFSR
ncbi:hypothetical protein F4805DRAFT_418830 [Annulohypoxylon moriforme]|nr:hypothetical protein F4805DRAFT_418830 [Annulohypoxylon moriforme]